MSEFSYIAITKDGRKMNDVIQAPNLAAAGHLLKEQGLLPTLLEERGQKSSFDILSVFSPIGLAEKIGFVENLGVMLKAGINISRALQILVKQTKNKKFQNILADVYAQVEQGKSLAESLGKYPAVFPSIVSSMIKVGELSGNLDKSLEYLTIQLNREADLRSKVRGAMIYPSVIVCAMVIIGILMSIFVLPSLTSIFKEVGTTLPPTTKFVIAFSDFMSQHTIIALGSLIAFIAALVAFYRTYTGFRTFNYICLHLMVIGTITKKLNLARFARVLSSMLKSGIPIVQALEVSGESLGNTYYKDLVVKTSDDVRVGKPLSESLGKDSSLFPVLVTQMIAVGEESGSLQEILEQLAGHYEEDVDTTLKNLSSIIEPLLLLVIGGVVGLLALSLIAPIYSVYQNAE